MFQHFNTENKNKVLFCSFFYTLIYIIPKNIRNFATLLNKELIIHYKQKKL